MQGLSHLATAKLPAPPAHLQRHRRPGPQSQARQWSAGSQQCHPNTLWGHCRGRNSHTGRRQLCKRLEKIPGGRHHVHTAPHANHMKPLAAARRPPPVGGDDGQRHAHRLDNGQAPALSPAVRRAGQTPTWANGLLHSLIIYAGLHSQPPTHSTHPKRYSPSPRGQHEAVCRLVQSREVGLRDVIGQNVHRRHPARIPNRRLAQLLAPPGLQHKGLVASWLACKERSKHSSSTLVAKVTAGMPTNQRHQGERRSGQAAASHAPTCLHLLREVGFAVEWLGVQQQHHIVPGCEGRQECAQ